VNHLNSQQVSELLERAGPQSTVYLIGAGGCGMSGLGHLLLDLGHQVAGSDLAANEEIRQLCTRGAQIHHGHEPEHITAAQPILVVYSSAVRADNPELHAAQQRQIPIVRRAVLLAALVHRQRGLCVAGMHGKTTTAALLAFALKNLKANPGYAVGALVPQFAQHAHFSSGAVFQSDLAGKPLVDSGSVAETRAHKQNGCSTKPYFVAEVDESDGTLCEFHPESAIILNVDEEHLDYYANLEAVCRQFEIFAGNTRGPLVFCADDTRLAEILAHHPKAHSYGFHPLAEYRLESKGDTYTSLHAGRCRAFEIWHGGEKLGEFSIQLLGQKNLSNACAVVVLLHQLGFGASEIAGAITGFQGAARRQQELFRDSRFCLVDDYGHHPAEIQATINAIKEVHHRRLLVAFQPHRFTRTRYLLDQFAKCFVGADRLWITEVYAASEAQIDGVNGQRLAAAVRAEDQAVEFIPTLAELRRAVRAAMLPGDLVLFLGAGDITRAAHDLAVELNQECIVQNEHLFARFAEKLSADSVIRADEPLAKRTTLRVGGRADLYIEPASESDLAQVLNLCGELHLPFIVLGRGSNLLIKDGGIRGVVICLAHRQLAQVDVQGEHLHCGAGAKLKAVAVEARRRGLAGLEFLEGIPGSVGGALRMNAGAMGSWMFEAVESVRFMDYSGKIHERKASEVYVEYRGCPLFKNHIALGAVLKGQVAPREVITQRMNQFSAKRWESQPAASSAGCIFKNPPTIPAGKLIDELGLKGMRVGAAAVSEVHGNFIVNEGGATARDVLNLIETIKQRAKSVRGIELETEVEILGDESPLQN